MFVVILVVALLSIMFFCTLGISSLNAIPLERLWRLREEKGRGASALEYWIAYSQQITWALRVISRVSCVALALILIAIVEGRPLPLYVFIIALAVATFLVAFPGSLIPSAWGQLAGERIALNMLPVIRMFGYILAPLLKICLYIVNITLRLLGRGPLAFKPMYLRNELEQCIGGFERSDRLADHEKWMIRHIFAFRDLVVSEIMTPTVSMICIAEQAAVSGAVKLIKQEHVSRIPVYRGSPHLIVGILYAKDLLERWGEAGLEGRGVAGLAREPFFIPETAKVKTLFSELLKRQVHIAIAVDEFGAATGLVTIEDILEEIVGPVYDEHDVGERRLCEKIGEGHYQVDARFPLIDARDEMGITIPEKEGYDTVGGFVCSYLGRIPAPGEVIQWDGNAITVLEATKKSVRRLEIKMKRT